MELGRFELCLQVADVRRSLDFYSKLGFQVVGGDLDQGVIVVENGDCRLGLYQQFIAENLLSFRGGDIEEIARKAHALHLSFEKAPFSAKDGTVAALLRDPDGNAVYLVSHPDE